MIMRVLSLLFVGLTAAITSTAPADAQDGKKPTKESTTVSQPRTYAECLANAAKLGWDSTQASSYCSGRKFKN
jgi:hypothetical protein